MKVEKAPLFSNPFDEFSIILGCPSSRSGYTSAIAHQNINLKLNNSIDFDEDRS